MSNTRSTPARPRADFEVTFKCLAKGDADLVRPDLRQTPDVVIEDRRK